MHFHLPPLLRPAMFKNITIKVRLIFVIVLLAVELVVGAAVGLFSLGHANDTMQSLYSDRLVGLGRLDQIVRKLNQNQLNLAAALSAEPGKVARLVEEIESSKQGIDEHWGAFSNTALTAHEKEIAARFSQARTKFVEQALKPAVAAIRAGDAERASTIVHGPMLELFKPVREAIDELIQVQLDEGANTSKSSQSTYELVRLVCLSGMTFGLLLAAVVGAMLVRGIVNPLEKAVRIAGAVASGDLTQTIETRSNDETGRLMRALHDMNEGLAKLVGRVRAGTETIATASGQIATGNLDLSAAPNSRRLARGNRRVDGRADLDRQAKRRQCAPGERSWRSRPRTWRARAAPWWRRWSRRWARSTTSSTQDRRHHRRHRRHRLPDQHPGAERGGGGGARRRTGPRLCGGRGRGAQPGAALAPARPRRSRR